MKARSIWRTTPGKIRVIFLLAVFFVFACLGFASDSIDMGHQPPLRFAVSVLLSGLFPVCYAATGVALRSRFWKAFLPLFAVQLLCQEILGHWLPDGARLDQLNAAQTGHLHARLLFDGIAIIISVTLGYVGFVWVTVSESRRHFRSQLEKATLESEMAAAREVQRVMVPEDLPPTTGYLIESVYLPAAEVGGDFFQVIPLKSGRTLVVIGDVSGKGLRAAMIVSMIIGIVRTISGFIEEPAGILAELNSRLYGRTHGGFVTCVAARLEDGGRLVLANAGHPPPCLNGIAVPFAGSLPLGLNETTAYEQSSLQINVGDVAVLLTDGIAEAQNKQGELLGFPRIESLLQAGASAKTIAEIAQQHGQNDDLTVISVVRQA
jgi:hypothetical protein